MVRVVGVRFRKAGKIYYFDPDGLSIPVGAKVVVETARGVEYGEVAVGPKDVPEEEVVQPLKKVLRVGTEEDARIAQENKRKEKEAFAIALEKIAHHGLDMTLVDVEYTFDNSKIIFYFTAEGRVDFRELVRDLASVFRTRIELRQIGVRDEAKMLGGIGPCGRELCCCTFLGEFAPVSIRMAKDQNLSLNPSKISGLCGRLMCCLRFEQETYEAAKKDPTLAPGYVPPVIPSDEEDLEELEELVDPEPPPEQAKVIDLNARFAKTAAVSEPEPLPELPPLEEKGGEADTPKAARKEKEKEKEKSKNKEKANRPASSKGHKQNAAKQGAERPAGRSGKARQGGAGARKGQTKERAAQPQAQTKAVGSRGGESAEKQESRQRSHRGQRRKSAEKARQEPLPDKQVREVAE